MNTKTAIITIAGRPNVGKSTLINHLVGEKIAIVSNKPQTTRNRICGIRTQDHMQFVFVDTPGYHKARTKLGDYMVNTVRESISDVDATLLVVEPIASVGSQEQALIEKIQATRCPSILVINKIDTVKREEILLFIDTYRKLYDFDEIVPVSALNGDNTDTLIEQIFKYLPYGPRFYDEDTVTDQPMRQIVANAGKEGAVIVQKVREGKGDFGYNARTDTFENLFETGVIDPAKVTRVALENAASIAGMMLTTECVIADKKEEQPAAAMPNMGGGMGGMM